MLTDTVINLANGHPNVFSIVFVVLLVISIIAILGVLGIGTGLGSLSGAEVFGSITGSSKS